MIDWRNSAPKEPVNLHNGVTAATFTWATQDKKRKVHRKRQKLQKAQMNGTTDPNAKTPVKVC